MQIQKHKLGPNFIGFVVAVAFPFFSKGIAKKALYHKWKVLMAAPILQRLAAVAVPLIFIQTVLVECSILLWPALPLLLIPSPVARKIFLHIAAWGQAAWLGLAVACLRFVSGTKIYIHTTGAMSLEDLQKMSGDLLMISNHPSRIDWMFLWAVAIALGRLPGLKIVLKDSLRAAPGFGWAMQCNAYPFVCRKDRDKDLETLRRVSSLAGEQESESAILLFPEGTDLSDRNLERSHAHSEKEGLPKYMQVLHPRTAGFETTWKAMKAVAKKKAAKNPPWLLDITVAYFHHVPGELPSETKFFGKGECVKEVHMLLQPISLNEQGEPTKSCTELWQEKEEMGMGNVMRLSFSIPDRNSP
eukprot:Skav203909  [mRNA]  locus=scaffold228:72261:73591:+ [translate_table: standard]